MFTRFMMLFCLIPTMAWAQSTTTSAPIAAQEKPAATTFTAGWRDGFVIQNDTGDFRLQIGALVQADARFALDDSAETLTDTFAMRRVRVPVRFRLYQRFELYVNPDFAGSTLTLYDAYLDTRFSNAFRVRFGKGKPPAGNERLQSASTILFLDRAFPALLTPNRDVGVQALGDIDGGVLSYQAGIFNGSQDNGVTDVDTNDGKDVAGRLVVKPFAKQAKSPLANLGFAFAGSRGTQSGAGALGSLRTGIMQQTFFSYTGSVADGTRARYSPFAFYYYKAFGGLVEYGHSALPIRKGTVRQDIANQAWQITGSYVLTGENASDAGVRPKNNFDFGKGHWGAFQIAARYHAISVDEAAIALGFATAGSSREAKAWTAGLNWYLNPFMKYVVNFEHVVFDDDADGPRKAENALAFRTQVSF
jgi:phosphate-selective porin OprO and OprP